MDISVFPPLAVVNSEHPWTRLCVDVNAFILLGRYLGVELLGHVGELQDCFLFLPAVFSDILTNTCSCLFYSSSLSGSVVVSP